MLATLTALVVVTVILAGMTAPYETLGWWAGWFGDTPGKPALTPESAAPRRGVRQFVIYLSGIDATAPDVPSKHEHDLLDNLATLLPEVCIVSDVFPYSSNNRALTGQRVFAWFWRRVAGLRGRGRIGLIAFLINLRNVWQVLVSSDARFGPLYNYATSELLYGKLLVHGYPVGSGVPVTLIGYSGGGQIALGAGPLLKRALGAPVRVISLGGVMSSNEDIFDLASVTHLFGSKDKVQRLGRIFFPQRWPVMRYSPWNRARRAGRVRFVPMGPVVHTGKGGYLDPNTLLPDGQSCLDKTTATMAEIIKEDIGSP